MADPWERSYYEVEEEKPSWLDKAAAIGDYVPKHPLLGIGEPMVTMATGLGGQIAGGWAGLLGLGAGMEPERAGQVTQDVAGALTYQPRTPLGKTMTAVGTAPIMGLDKFSDWASGASDDPLTQTIIDQGIDVGVPTVVGALGARVATKPPKIKPATRPAGSAKIDPRIKQSLQRTGADWNKLPAKIRETLIRISKDAKNLDNLDDAAIDRIVRAESLDEPITLTRGRATRDTAQLRREHIAAEMPEGADLRALAEKNNRALSANLDILKKKEGGMTTADARGRISSKSGATLIEQQPKDPRTNKPIKPQTGPEGALAMASRKSQENVSRLYNIADNSAEGLTPVNPTKLLQWLDENAELAATVAPSINAVKLRLMRLGVIGTADDGSTIVLRNLKLREMERIRQFANKAGKAGGTDGNAMSTLKHTIDDMTKNAGGDLYKEARQARTLHANEYENPRLIAKLLTEENTSGSVAFDQVFNQTIIRGSPRELGMLKKLILEHPDKQVRSMGRTAWKNLVSETIEYLKAQALKGTTQNAAGDRLFSANNLDNAMNVQIGREKLGMIFGKKGVNYLDRLLQTAHDETTIPPTKVGSTTVPNLIAMIDKVGEFLPGWAGGGIVAGAGRKMGEMHAAGAAKRTAADAIQGVPEMRPTVPTRTVKAGGRTGEVPIRPRPPFGYPTASRSIPLSQIGRPTDPARERQDEFIRGLQERYMR
jgi:hypothetical protein